MRLFAWTITSLWRTSVDWRAKRPLLCRTSAHLSLILLAILAVAVSGIELPARAGIDPVSALTANPGYEAVPTPQAGGWESASLGHPSTGSGHRDDGTVTRLALPRTTIPARPRPEVEVYIVREGDSVWGIANAFGLTPYTIYWANSETLEDNPHLLHPGMELYILPVDGVYVTVSEGDTVASLAEEYGVEPEALYNEWNDLERGRPLVAGQKLIIPGGTREFVVWQMPRYTDLSGTAARGVGVCAPPATGLTGYGWFNWPTLSYAISGWYFRDPRNPPHIGIDIRADTGDPLYAADSGTVVYAGRAGGYGNLIVLDHGNGYQTYYAHLSEFAVGCGMTVLQGGVIGYAGNTGWSTGPHLHFEIRYAGIPQNPLDYLP